MINWYNEVSRNLDKIPDCVAYFDKELLEAKKQCKIYGNLERASASLPGIVEERFRSNTGIPKHRIKKIKIKDLQKIPRKLQQSFIK